MTLRFTEEQFKELQKKASQKPIGNQRSYSKYKNKIVIINGKRFDSLLEGNYYIELLRLQKIGIVSYFLRQVPIELSEYTSDKYRLDFLVFYSDGQIEFIDVKGIVTKEFRLKKSLIEGLYPFKIKLVKSKSITNYLKTLVPDQEGKFYYH